MPTSLNKLEWNAYQRKYQKRNREKLKEFKEIHEVLKEHYPYFLKHIKQQYCKG